MQIYIFVVTRQGNRNFFYLLKRKHGYSILWILMSLNFSQVRKGEIQPTNIIVFWIKTSRKWIEFCRVKILFGDGEEKQE